jgi:hypothetical protein
MTNPVMAAGGGSKKSAASALKAVVAWNPAASRARYRERLKISAIADYPRDATGRAL